MKTQLVLAACLLAGCATSPVATDHAKQVPPERLLAADLLIPDPGTCEVKVKRDKGMLGVATSINIQIDGEKAAQLHTAEVATFYLKSGQRLVAAMLPQDGLNHLIDDSRGEVAVDCKPGESHTLRTGFAADGTVQLQFTQF